MGHAQSTPGPPRSRRRAVLAGLAAAIPLVPVVVGLSLSSGSGTRAPATSTSGAAFAQAPPPAAAQAASRPSRPSGTVVALLTRATTLRAAPGGRPIGPLALRTGFGSPQALLVVATRPGWLGVLSPLAGNGHTGWIPRGTASLGRVDWHIEVSLARRQITISREGRTLARYRTAIGMPSAPTPTGRFAVTDRLLTGDPGGPYGCCILALSAHAPHAIQDWSGGDRIAIHATPELASIGAAASHGCLRVSPADGRWLLAHIPLGTPVVIRA